MANHLTPDQIARFAQRRLSPADLEVLGGHLANCDICRQAVSDPQQLQAAYELLRRDLKRQEELGLTHISYEQLEAYVDNKIESADREIIDSHVELCATCRAELRDLQEFRPTLGSRDLAPDESEMERLTLFASADETEIPESESEHRKVVLWRHPGFLAVISVVAAAVLIAAWLLPVLHHAPPNTAHLPASQPGTSPPGTSPPGTSQTTQAPQDLHLPAELTALIGKRETLLSDSTQLSVLAQLPPFELLEPVGTFVGNVQPVFSWKPLSGSSRYQVTVVNSDLREVLQSPKIAGTSWKASRVLERGKVYQWQVTAFRGSEQIVTPAPPAPEAKFEIIQQSSADVLDQLKLTQPSNHFALGYAYANAGMLDQAETEFQLIARSDANYELAVTFLAELRLLRQPRVIKQLS